MSTFLQLCQETARESGTIPTIGDPQTAQGQTGRLLRLTQWVATAYEMIQLRHNNWRWLEAEFLGQTTSGQVSYSAAAMGVSSRFGRWLERDIDGTTLTTVYGETDYSDEMQLQVVDWQRFRQQYYVGSERGETTPTGEAPRYISFAPDNKLWLWRIPSQTSNSTDWYIRRRYYKAPQILSADADVPEMPEAYHRLIVYEALLLLAEFDEAAEQYNLWRARRDSILHQLEVDQLPRIRRTEPLA